jgi:hypothetical protein
MATAKPGKRSKSPSESPAPAKRAARAATPTLESVKAEIAALRRSDFADKLSSSVRDLVSAAKRTRNHAMELREFVLKKSRLDPAVLDAFPHGINALREFEAAWQAVRARGATVALTAAREKGADLRREAISVLRHFVAKDRDLQIVLDEIAEGDGDDDLVDDLEKLAPLVDEHWDAIAGSEDLPPERGDAFSKAAAELDDARTDKAPSPEARKALELRDKAYFYVLEAEREIRACGKHAFRKQPKVAELFSDVLFGGRSTPSKPTEENPKPA